MDELTLLRTAVNGRIQACIDNSKNHYGLFIDAYSCDQFTRGYMKAMVEVLQLIDTNQFDYNKLLKEDNNVINS